MAGRKPKNPEDRKNYSGKEISLFSRRVRDRRIQLGLNQSQLASKTGYRQAQVSAIEGGVFVENFDRLVSLSRALETTPDYLFGFREEP